MYDLWNYPPTFGGGHDLFLGNNGQSSAYSNPSNYQVGGCGATFTYDNSFFSKNRIRCRCLSIIDTSCCSGLPQLEQQQHRSVLQLLRDLR